MFKSILSWLGFLLLLHASFPSAAQSNDSVLLVQQQIAAKNYAAAAATYRRNTALPFPPSVQRDMMKVCKETGDTALALLICRAEQAKAPQDDYWQVREMQFLVYAQQYAAAEKKAQAVRNKASADFKEIELMLLTAQEKWVEILDQTIRDKGPNGYTDQQLDQILFCFLKLKAGLLAAKWVMENSVPLTPQRLFWLRNAQAANWLRWANETARNDAEKIQFAQNGLRLIDQMLLDSSLGKADRKYLLYDQVTAHQVAKQYDSCLLFYDRLTQPVPAYVKQAAAQSALELRYPEKSASLFREVFQADSTNTTALQGLSFALADQNKHDENLALLAFNSNRYPLLVDDRGTGQKELNDKRFSVDAQSGRSLEYAGFLDSSLKTIGRLQRQSPLDFGLYQLRGNVYSAKGQYRQALQYYDLAYYANPRDAGIAYNRSGSFFRQLQFDSVQQILLRLRRDFPQSDARARLEKEWKEHNMAEFMAGADYSYTEGPVQNGNAFTLWTEAATRPMGLFWRVRANAKQEWSTLPEGTVQFGVVGISAEYRRKNWEVQGGLQGNFYTEFKTGFRLKSVHQLTDKWRLSVTGEKFSTETPFRALFYKVYADRIGGDLGFAPDEKTSFAGALSYMPFTDGNRRRSWSLGATRRLFYRPAFQVMGILGLGGSDNRPGQQGISKPIAYFNPGNDFSGTLSLRLQHQLYRRYEKSYFHLLQLHQVQYRQLGFDPFWVGGVRYEQHFAFSYTKELKWAVGRGQYVFDGSREPYVTFEISFYGRF